MTDSISVSLNPPASSTRPSRPSRLRRAISAPWFQLLAIGAVVFALQQWWFPPQLGQVLYPPPERIAELREQWFRRGGFLPDAEQTQALIDGDIEQSILVQEALRRGYHLDDPLIYQRLLKDAAFLGLEGEPEEQIRQTLELGVQASDQLIRRRLIQRMEAMAAGRLPAPRDIPREALEPIFNDPERSWELPARYSFEQLFFSIDTRRDPAADARKVLAQVLAQTQTQADAADISSLGDPFMHGRHYRRYSSSQLQKNLGYQFAEDLVAQPIVLGQWFGPIASAYGQHLIKLSDYVPPRQQSLEEVQDKLEYEWLNAEKRRRVTAYVAKLRERYEVIR